jgi:hypothetical protein
MTEASIGVVVVVVVVVVVAVAVAVAVANARGGSFDFLGVHYDDRRYLCDTKCRAHF